MIIHHSLAGRNLATVLLGIWLQLTAGAATSVTYYDITWTFSADRPTGTFANGEPWVVGPVTITQITPNPSQSTFGVQNGSMKNPVAGTRNGFTDNADSVGHIVPRIKYDATKNVALQLPLNLVGGDTLASSKTVYSYPNYAETICVLTVVVAAPPVGSFRPGPYGTNHAIRWNKSQINYSVLKNFPTVAGAPTKATIEAKLPPLPWWEWDTHDSGSLLCPWRNYAAGNDGSGKPSTYGREIAFKWGDVALWLNLNNTQADKEKAMIQSIQCGIDIASYLANGGGFYPGGGHKCGRKFPVLLAAVALNDPILLALARDPDVFQEDTQTWIVTQSDVGRAVATGKITYDQSHVGMAEWGVVHRWDPYQDNSAWSATYRAVVWPAMGGQVLAAELMGLQVQWNHPAIFAYNERYKSMAGLSVFTNNMWNAYKGVTPPVVSISTPSFTPGGGSYAEVQNVTITCATPGTSIRYTTNGSTPTATSGTVYSGPVAIGVGTTTLNAIAYDANSVTSAVMSATYAITGINQAATPTASPSGGAFLVSQLVTLATSTAGSTIRYTVNGAVPDGTSPVYTAPFTVATNTTVKAIASMSGMTNSPIMSAVFTIGSLTVGNQWANVPLVPKSAVFSLAIDAVPSAAGIDALVGLSTNSAAAFTDLAVIIRFSPSGVIDARDGGTYAAANVLPYVAGTNYHFNFVVDVPNHRYSATATVPAGTPVLIADNYAFRTEQAAAASIANLAMFATSGSSTFTNLLLSTPPSPPGNVRIAPP